jgi:hypothetical protein
MKAVMADENDLFDAQDFEHLSDEPIASVLDIASWSSKPDLAALIDRIEAEVGDAVRRESEMASSIRRDIFPRIADPARPDAAPGCGIYQAEPADLKRIWKQALFNGGVEVCDGTRMQISTLPLTITQLGVCLACYSGDQQSFGHRIFQRDLRGASGNLLEDVLTLLDRRAEGGDPELRRNKTRGASDLLLRGIMAHAERAVLTDVSTAPWRMGHGHPAPYELLTGAGLVSGGGEMPLLRAAYDTLSRLVLGHRRFVFVPSDVADRRLLTLGNALRPCEYAIVSTALNGMSSVTRGGKYNPTSAALAHKFAEELGTQIAIGVFRASAVAPPHIFFSHIDHSHEAALIALADSLLQQHRGFPLLIDLADRLCQSTFGNDVFDGAVQTAFARAHAPYNYLSEHATRH